MIRTSIYGRLGSDPVQRRTRSGDAMATASLAVNVARPDADEDICWFGLAAFGRNADVLLRHAKGDLLAAMGELHRRRFTGRDGEGREQWSLTADAIVSARTVRPGGGRKPQRNGRAASPNDVARPAEASEEWQRWARSTPSPS